MPAKSNVRKSTSKSGGFKFNWWMGLGLVLVIALVGLLVLRFSKAGTAALISCGNYPPNISNVSMQYVYNKGTPNTQNVCMMKSPYAFSPLGTKITPGAAATYCVKGRYVGDISFTAIAYTPNNTTFSSQPSNLSAANSYVRGFGNNWIADPVPGTGGGDVTLACTRVQTPDGATSRIDFVSHGNGLVFMHAIDVVDIHN